MKKLFCFLFTLLLLITLQSTAFAQDQAEVSTEKIDTSAWVTYKIKELGMSIKLPPDMKVYTRESIKKGNVEEDEKLANVISNFEDKDLIFEAISTEMNFNLYIFNFNGLLPLLKPNLYKSTEENFQTHIDFFSNLNPEINYSMFISPYGKFTKSTEFDITSDTLRTFVSYDTLIDYQNIVITFSSYQHEISNHSLYDEIASQLQLNSYCFNFICLIVACFILFMLFLIYKLILKLTLKV